MSWRNIGWALGHLARTTVDADGIGAITTPALNSDWEDPALMPWYLIDDRAQAVARYSTAEPDHDVELDAASPTTESICYIPAGHNLDGVEVELYGGATSPASTLVDTTTGVAGAPLIFLFPEASWQFWRLQFNATGQWEIPEWVLAFVEITGQDEATSRGPEPRYREEPLDNTELIPYESGAQAALTLGTSQLQTEYEYLNLTRQTPAHDVFDQLALQHGTRHPFLLRPSGETDADWRWMYQVTEQTRVQGKDAPAAQDAISDTITVRAVENTA